jgi:hypothetical protein
MKFSEGYSLCIYCGLIIIFFAMIVQTVLTCEFQFTRERKRRSLKDLAAEVLGAKIQQSEHCPVCDATYMITDLSLASHFHVDVTSAHDYLHGHLLMLLLSYRLRMLELPCSFTISTRRHGRRT